MMNIRQKFAQIWQMKTRCSSTMSRQFCLSPSLRESINPGTQTHRPNNLEKRFLVWTGKYKQIKDIPDFVSNDVMERTRNKIRIRLANIMMVLTVIGCIAMVISGKTAREKGESVTKENLDWHKRYNESKENEK